MSSITPLFTPTTKRPSTQNTSNSQAGISYWLTLLKDFLSLPAWLEIGAALFIPVYLLLHRFLGAYTLLVPFLALALRFTRSLMQVYGLAPNKSMEGVIQTKYATQIPNDDGSFGPEAANKPITVFLIGVKNNHPMGLLAPGFKEIGDYFTRMNKELEEKGEEYGLLGNNAYIEFGGRSSNNQIMAVMYFKDTIGLNKYAHGDLHKEGWNWYHKMSKIHPHLAIFHEVYTAPAGAWEGLYVNSKPMLMAANSYPILENDGEGEIEKFSNGIVDARKGVMASMKGRMPLYGEEMS